MRVQNIFILLMLLIVKGCAQLSGRSFLTEMEQDDSRFYEPRDDFPIVTGDTGRFWNSEKEQRARTPASMQDIAEDKARYSLRAELRELEDRQGESGRNLYARYEQKFRSISEKIYFLNIPAHERMEYLESRGFVNRSQLEGSEKKSAMSGRKPRTKQGEGLFGMSKDDVLVSWGNPLRVEIAGNPTYENERWVYNLDGATKYIYFESGRVQGWE